MKHLICLVLLLWAVIPLAAQPSDTTETESDSTAFLHPDYNRELNFGETTRAVFDPVGYVSQHAFSFPAFSTIPGETEPYQNVRYSLADGLYLGLGSDTRRALWFDSTLLVNGGFGYATGSHYWQVFGGLDKRFGQRETATLIGGEAHILTGSHDAWRSAPWENTFFSLFYTTDNRNWFRRSGWSAHAEQHTEAGLTASVSYGQERYEYLPKDSWSLLDVGGDRGEYKASPVFEPAQTKAVTIAAVYSSMPPLPRFLGGVRASAQTEIGTYHETYNRTVFDVVWHQPVWPTLTFNARLRSGTASGGDVIVPKLFTLGGHGTLPGFAWNELSGNRMTLLNTEIMFSPSPFAKSRFWSSLSILLLADAGYTSLQDDDSPLLTGLLPTAAKDWRTDIGLAYGLRNGLIAWGIVWRTDTGRPSFFFRLSSVYR